MSEQRKLEVYGAWTGRPQGTKEDPARCIEHVYDPQRSRGMISAQCTRKRGYGPNGLFCKQHAKNAKMPL